jgi:hypothetical protein
VGSSQCHRAYRSQLRVLGVVRLQQQEVHGAATQLPQPCTLRLACIGPEGADAPAQAKQIKCRPRACWALPTCSSAWTSRPSTLLAQAKAGAQSAA